MDCPTVEQGINDQMLRIFRCLCSVCEVSNKDQVSFLQSEQDVVEVGT